MNYRANPALRIRLEDWRVRLSLVALFVCFGGLIARAGYLQTVRRDFLQQEGDARYSRVIELPANRGKVSDRNGEPLAISTPMESVWVTTDLLKYTPEQLKALAGLLRVDIGELRKRLEDSDAKFFRLGRQIPPDIAARIAELHIPGLIQKREYRRYYPAGQEVAHLIGYTDADNKGSGGVELAYDNVLAGQPGAKRVIKDRTGHVVEDVASIRPPQQGRDITLAIDSHIQYIAYRELKAAVAANRAKGGAIMVLSAKTGEVLALSNLPDFNPNDRNRLNGNQLRNRGLIDTFEPGSTLKPFTVAAALESGAYTPETLVQTAPGWLAVGPNVIHDAHRNGMLSVAQVIQKSSNVGAARIALSLQAETMWNLFNDLGFGASPQTGFPGEARGHLRPYKTWRPIEQATMSYGHGISVSLSQLVRAYTVFANDGEIVPINMLKTDEPVLARRVISSATARAVSAMLETVVQAGGTAPRAAIPGYRVAGKTGTAHKQSGTAYARDRYVSSFVGYAPASSPRLVVGVMIDEPNAGEYYGGTVAAPAFAAVMEASLRALGVPQDAPLTPAAPATPPAAASPGEDT